MGWFLRPTETVITQYAGKTATDVVPALSGKQLVFLEATLNNRAGSAQIMGLGFKMDNTRWKAGQWANAGSAYTDDTTDAQDAGTNDFALTTTTNNDGFIVQSTKKFGIVGIQVTTAQAGTPVYEYTYWNGSAFATLTTIEVPASYTAAEHAIVFAPPVDWAVIGTNASGLDPEKYVIRVRATTAPSTAPLASLIWVARLYDYKEDVADNTVLNFVVAPTHQGLVLHGGDSIIPYFGTASANNSISVRYTYRG